MINALCIGGPYNGRKFASEKDYFYVAHRNSPLSVTGYHDMIDKTIVDRTEYRLQTFSFPVESDLTVWAPREQSHHQTMKILFEFYERSHQ